MLPKPNCSLSPLRFTRTPSPGHIPGFAGIYRLVCVPRGMAYVGQTHDLARRCLEHQVQLMTGQHLNTKLQHAYNRYGPDGFYFQVLELYHGPYSPDCLSPAEQRWMDAHTRLFNFRPAGSDEYIESVKRLRRGQ